MLPFILFSNICSQLRYVLFTFYIFTLLNQFYIFITLFYILYIRFIFHISLPFYVCYILITFLHVVLKCVLPFTCCVHVYVSFLLFSMLFIYCTCFYRLYRLHCFLTFSIIFTFLQFLRVLHCLYFILFLQFIFLNVFEIGYIVYDVLPCFTFQLVLNICTCFSFVYPISSTLFFLHFRLILHIFVYCFTFYLLVFHICIFKFFTFTMFTCCCTFLYLLHFDILTVFTCLDLTFVYMFYVFLPFVTPKN